MLYVQKNNGNCRTCNVTSSATLKDGFQLIGMEWQCRAQLQVLANLERCKISEEMEYGPSLLMVDHLAIGNRRYFENGEAGIPY